MGSHASYLAPPWNSATAPLPPHMSQHIIIIISRDDVLIIGRYLAIHPLLPVISIDPIIEPPHLPGNLFDRVSQPEKKLLD